MKKCISVVALTSLFAAGTALASGYRIPEQSLDSTAKAGANVASASSADTSYYNPAGMAFMDDAWHLEGTATYLHLTSIDYDDNRSSFYDGESDEENFLLPTFFTVSPDYNNFRFGFSLTPSYGLSKRWTEDPYPQAFAEKAALKVFEFNPTVSYKFSDMFSVGGGVRMVYAKATLMNNPSELPLPAAARTAVKLSGDTTEWGYNLAMDLKPSDAWNFALTYRSKIDLDFDDGDVDLYPLGNTALVRKMEGSTSLPAPAVLAFSTAYTFSNWTFDLTIDQTFWSDYEELTLEFQNPALNTTIDKDWDDSTCVRLGVEYRLDEAVTLMGGIAYDENPIPDETLGFELPDSDAWLFSAGVRYAQNENLEYGVAVLYDYKDSRDENNLANGGRVNGEFTNASAWLVSLGVSYKF